MKTLKFLFISLFATALAFFLVGVMAETFTISQWPAGFKVLFLVGVGAVDLQILKMYSKPANNKRNRNISHNDENGLLH